MTKVVHKPGHIVAVVKFWRQGDAIPDGWTDIGEWNSRADDNKAEFKNFHRLLCERFGYGHDPVDWQRDQLSLIEHIANSREVAVEKVGDVWTCAYCHCMNIAPKCAMCLREKPQPEPSGGT